MDKYIRRTLKKAFYTYQEMSKNAVHSTVEWAESIFAVDYSKERVKSSASNVKEGKLCKIIDDNLTAIRWCTVVEKVLDYYKWDGREKLIRQRYFEKKSITAICLNIGICRSTFFIWSDEILLKAEQWARELRLL